MAHRTLRNRLKYSNSRRNLQETIAESRPKIAGAGGDISNPSQRKKKKRLKNEKEKIYIYKFRILKCIINIRQIEL